MENEKFNSLIFLYVGFSSKLICLFNRKQQGFSVPNANILCVFVFVDFCVQTQKSANKYSCIY